MWQGGQGRGELRNAAPGAERVGDDEVAEQDSGPILEPQLANAIAHLAPCPPQTCSPLHSQKDSLQTHSHTHGLAMVTPSWSHCSRNPMTCPACSSNRGHRPPSPLESSPGPSSSFCFPVALASPRLTPQPTSGPPLGPGELLPLLLASPSPPPSVSQSPVPGRPPEMPARGQRTPVLTTVVMKHYVCRDSPVTRTPQAGDPSTLSPAPRLPPGTSEWMNPPPKPNSSDPPPSHPMLSFAVLPQPRVPKASCSSQQSQTLPPRQGPLGVTPREATPSAAHSLQDFWGESLPTSHCNELSLVLWILGPSKARATRVLTPDVFQAPAPSNG